MFVSFGTTLSHLFFVDDLAIFNKTDLDHGNGNKIRCWNDNWVPGVGPLINLIPTNVNIVSNCLLNEMAIEEGLWNLDLFKIWLLDDVVRCIVAVPPPHLFEGTDRVAWCHTLRRAFSIKNAFKILNEESQSANDDKWKCLWKLLGP
ncbi:hypothetical protein J1N35_034379 [Gossypium stocksii]|uniref:Reverse transcriptase zinc-binding domain-containing protein n=1 Tax=Gossypium stocksii TaxID=47602 RepID=A0A9D3UTT9_9ROSI|nr:hypothetical protein J1N35_034379 [Gossypium stocksii]